jgi:hypothetical protein
LDIGSSFAIGIWPWHFPAFLKYKRPKFLNSMANGKGNSRAKRQFSMNPCQLPQTDFCHPACGIDVKVLFLLISDYNFIAIHP